MRLYAVITAASLVAAASASAAPRGGNDEAPLATPVGVLTQQVSPKGDNFVYADVDGLAFYTYAKDTAPGKSACNDECAKTMPPVRPPAGAALPARWSAIARDDGSPQLAYKGKPLYKCAADKDIGKLKCKGADSGAWREAAFTAQYDIELPVNIAIAEIAEASGHGLVDSQGLPLYAYTGDIDRDATKCDVASCGGIFTPFAAPMIARQRGDFTVVKRRDGFQQWAYKGKPLYTFTGDQRAGDAMGRGLDKRFNPAMMTRFFLPPGVSIRSDGAIGGILTTPQGMSLYAMDTIVFMGDFGAPARGGMPGYYEVGLAIGTLGCDTPECKNSFLPFVAEKGAQPSGFWTILTRKDGTRQWAYQNYALYTHVNDTRPGLITGRDILVPKLNETPEDLTPVIEGMRNFSGRGTGFTGYVWRPATPSP